MKGQYSGGHGMSFVRTRPRIYPGPRRTLSRKLQKALSKNRQDKRQKFAQDVVKYLGIHEDEPL